MSPKKANAFTPKTPISTRLNDFFRGKKFVEISGKIYGKNKNIDSKTIANTLKGNFPPSSLILEYVASNGGDVHYILTGEKKENSIEQKKIDDKFLKLVVDDWRFLSEKQKGEIAGLVSEYTNLQKNNGTSKKQINVA